MRHTCGGKVWWICNNRVMNVEIMAENLDDDWDYGGMDWQQVQYQKRRKKSNLSRFSGSSEDSDDSGGGRFNQNGQNLREGLNQQAEAY